MRGAAPGTLSPVRQRIEHWTSTPSATRSPGSPLAEGISVRAPSTGPLSRSRGPVQAPESAARGSADVVLDRDGDRAMARSQHHSTAPTSAPPSLTTESARSANSQSTVSSSTCSSESRTGRAGETPVSGCYRARDAWSPARPEGPAWRDPRSHPRPTRSPAAVTDPCWARSTRRNPAVQAKRGGLRGTAKHSPALRCRCRFDRMPAAARFAGGGGVL